MGIASVALIAASCAPYTYNSRTTRPNRDYSSTDFDGTWRLVSRSSTDRAWTDERSRFDAGDWRTEDQSYARSDAWFLPDEFRITGGRDMLRIEDDGGALIAEVPMDSDYRYGSYDDQYSRPSHGYWTSDRQLEIQRFGRHRRLTQTFSLHDRSRRMDVVTRIESDRGTRTFTRTYVRV
jgi:hypothetical protein